jgi:hypothetical protein
MNRLLISFLLTVAALGPSALTTQAHFASGAWLDGEPVSVRQAGQHHCIAGVRLECYSSHTARDRALHAARENAASGASALTSGYVIAYVDASFGGASIVLTQDYSDLSTIGWNDKISSYKVFTSLTGSFWTAANYSGVRQTYCCFTNVSYVGNSVNDTFSSFDLP